MRTLLSLAALILLPGFAAAESTVVELWPDGVPNAHAAAGPERIENGRIYNVQRPTLTRFPAAKPCGTAVILAPGGGYERLAIPADGGPLTRWLNELGTDVFVLKYRLKEYGHPAPLQDVLQAVRLLRARAADFGLNPQRIGIFGASAGGHVAACAGTLYDLPEGDPAGRMATVSARPDFLVLLYPVITMKPPYAHQGSVRALLGPTPTAELLDLLSVDEHVTAKTPPCFLIHTTQDNVVPLENSVRFFLALRHAGVPVEMHLYEQGQHGFGIRNDLGTTSGWHLRAAEWLRARGLVPN